MTMHSACDYDNIHFTGTMHTQKLCYLYHSTEAEAQNIDTSDTKGAGESVLTLTAVSGR